MPDNFVPLKCQSCGGKLDVYLDMERFACGYCGTEMVVQRRGGTVALKLVQEAVKKVQIGTDKTAAELAIVRCEREMKGLRGKESLLSARQTAGSFFGVGCGGLVILIGFSLFSQKPFGVGVGLVSSTIQSENFSLTNFTYAATAS